MQRLDPKVIIVFFIKNLIETIYILPLWWVGIVIFEHIGTKYFTLLPHQQIILLLDGAGVMYLIILILFSYYRAWFTYVSFAYSLENDGIHINRGIILKRHTIIPYTYIQDIQVYVNPLVARFLGLYNLHIKVKKIVNSSGVLYHGRDENLPGLTSDILTNVKSQLIASSHILAVKPRKYFDPTTGMYH